MQGIEKTLRFVALGCVFLVPFVVLIVAESLFFPFITGKNFVFRVLVEVAVAAWLALALVNPLYRPKLSWLLGAFALFVASIALSDALGVYPWKSFWSNFERMDGWVTLAHLFAYFVVAASLLSTDKLWRAWWHTSLGVSVLVAGYALLQLAGFFTINQGGIRLDATLGNSTYLGIYMLFHIFIAAAMLARQWVSNPRNRLLYVFLYGPLIALHSCILFFTATRGAILGLLGGALLAALLTVLLSSDRRVMWRAGAVVIAFLLAGFGFLMVREPLKETGFEPVRRLATISLSEGTVASRFMNIGMAWEGVKERPLLGWGQENYAAVFDRHYDPNMWAQEPWFDRVHNVLFDWLVAGGLVGLVLYLFIWFFALRALWRPGAFARHEQVILTGLLAGYFFYNLFTFDNITSYILFISILAWIAVREGEEREPIFARRALPRAALPILAIFAVVLAWGLAWGVNARALAANRSLIMGLATARVSPEVSFEHFSAALAKPSMGTQEAREHLMQAAATVRMRENVSNDIKIRFADFAARELDKQVADAPFNTRAPLFLGTLLDAYGVPDQAARALEVARIRSPQKQSVMFQQGQNAFARGEEEEALDYFREAHELAPEYPEARTLYLLAAVTAGREELVRSLAEPIMEGAAPIDPRVAGALARQGSYELIVFLWEKRIAAHPEDVSAHFTLAAAYYALGETSRALAQLEEAKQAAPEAAEDAEAIAERIRAGTLEIQ